MSSTWVAAPSVGFAALGRHHVGGRRRLARALPLLASLLTAVALVGGSPGHGAAPCGHAAGSRHLWPSRGHCLRPQVSPLQAPAMPAGDHACWRLPLADWLLLQGGFGHGRPPPYRGPWPQPAWPWVAGPAWG
ncbi:hypothetical protein BHM03_00057641 [Ensete ventricosum]|nr:hypothetical protein BHM03_00057641 [Ensete ventricosum]